MSCPQTLELCRAHHRDVGKVSGGHHDEQKQTEIDNARAQITVVVSFRGIASGHLEKRSVIVRRCVNPFEGGSGPTRSTCMWSKRRFGKSNCSSGALMCVWIFELWQGMHVRTQFPTCFLSPFHTNLELMSFLVVRIEGLDRQCIRAMKLVLLVLHVR